VFSHDQRSLYGANRRVITALRRSSRTGRLRPVIGRGACLSASRLTGCRRQSVLNAAAPDATWRLLMSTGDRTLYALADADSGGPWKLFAFRRDRESGALAALPDDRNCIAGTRVAGCRRVSLPGGGLEDVGVDPGGRALYLIGESSLVVVRTDPTTGAFQPADRTDNSACLAARATPGCVVVAGIPRSENGGSATLSADGRTLYATYSGRSVAGAPEFTAGAILALPRDDAGRLLPGTGTVHCASTSASLYDTAPDCEQWDMLGGELSPPLVVGSDVYVPSKGGAFDDDITLVHFRTDAIADPLTPAAGPGACLGTAMTSEDLGHEPRPSVSEPCQRVRGLREFSLTPVLSPDGRDVIILTAFFGYDLPVEDPAIVDLERDPESGRLTQRPGAAGCLQPRPRRGCGRFAQLDIPMALEFAPDGDRALLITATNDDNESLLELSRDRTGTLHPPSEASGCVSVRSQPSCGRLRGTHAEPYNSATPVISRDGRFAYLLEDGVAVLRLA
jgi:hypothetical protein